MADWLVDRLIPMHPIPADRTIIAQLKVNLRPLWQPACTAIISLSQQHPKALWDTLFSELRKAVQGDLSLFDAVPALWATADTEEVDDQEAERTWRCPSAARFHVGLSKWTKDDASSNAVVQVRHHLASSNYAS